MKRLLYHGTNVQGITGIINSGFVGTEYFDGWGVYLTTDKEDALNHGPYVLVFENIEGKLEQDGVNDGYLYRGKIKKQMVSYVTSVPGDPRIMRDLFENAGYWQQK